MTIEQKIENGFTARVIHDPHGNVESPREYESSTFFGFHRSYASPDTAPDTDPHKARAIAESDQNIWLPVWLFAHSGTCYKAAQNNPFHCPWDSGLFGFIYISRADARVMYGVKRITEKMRQTILTDLIAQVDVYSQWANGETYGWEVVDSDGETLESCFGYYCTDLAFDDAKQCLATFTK